MSRKTIINYIQTQLKLINGSVSTLDSSYTYNHNLFNNVYRQLKFIDEINDFPSLYMSVGTEFRDFQTKDFTRCNFQIIIRGYIKSDSTLVHEETLINDVEHVIYNMPQNPGIGLIEVVIDEISSTNGLLEPYGIIEITLNVLYEL